MGLSPRPRAVVTGASAGLGAEFARLLAARGYDLLLVARRTEQLDSLASSLQNTYRINAEVLSADLAEPAGVEAVVTAAGVPDVLVNNAGFGKLGEFATADPVETRRMIRVNVEALTHLTAALLPGMLARGRGRILNVASTAAFQPGPLMAVYYATKAYVLSFSEAVSAEVRGTGVTVTCLCPGPTATEFADVSGMNRTSLFSGPAVMTAADVCAAGIDGLFAGRRLVIPGIRNRMLVFAVRFAPRGLVLRTVERFQRSRS